jgi:phosphatidylserine/phosphatidylglycerophosphate/cardiolipin synthase-like enzyme
MATEVTTSNGISVTLTSQIDGKVEDKPVNEQAALQAIEAQAGEIADHFVEFVNRATKTLDICIYDFRLTLPAVSQKVVKAVNAAAARGVAVRVAYDANQKSDEEIIKQFRGAGGDPAPTGTEAFLKEKVELHPEVEIKAIAEQGGEPLAAGVANEPIAPGSQIMHQKYMVADAETDDAAVWMGSANFTVDAWALQDNNIAVLESRELADKYTQDFEELWKSENLRDTGKNDQGSVSINGMDVRYAFAPGEGTSIRDLISEVIAGGKQRIRIASMVTSSPDILEALKERIDGGVDFAGVYDYGESTQVLHSWAKYPADAEKAKLLEAVLAHMVPKHSQPFLKEHPDWAHNFMHNKVVVADDTIIIGSFNFSSNAMRNAENILCFTEPKLAKAYADYIDSLVERYG